ncbi:MAG TPA: UbiA family prenyltransferase [Gemmataceae bacterium]|nr:UbiA family prenyltransferase [Gemmataceae bacterium]
MSHSDYRMIRAYAQLVRLPNVFTALADICLGALAAGTLAVRWPAFGLLLLASACLYCGGMVWNDYFDLEQDRRERPFRPLPSGRITPRAAARFGTALLAGGVLFALLAGWVLAGGSSIRWGPVVLAGLLVGAILLYDGWLKRTWAGPLGMGACRFLNVLLGLTLADNLGGPGGVHLALVVGLYIVGVTWFARTEARLSSQRALAGAAALMLASLLLALPLPARLEPGTSSPLFPYLLVVLGFVVGLPVYRAIIGPTPPRVQAAVKRALIGLVVLDATLATALAGAVGLVILVLLLPVLYLGRWIYQT